MNGTIKTIVSDRGFGFIKAEDGTDYFFHDSDVVDARLVDLFERDAVSFDEVLPVPAKGPRAMHVKINRGDVAS